MINLFVFENNLQYKEYMNRRKHSIFSKTQAVRHQGSTFLDNLLTDGGAVSLMHWPPFTPRKIPGTHFCQRLSRPQGHSVVGRIRTAEKSNDLIWNRTRDFQAFSIVPQPTMCPNASYSSYAN
jgi:hypothetical protein